TPSRKPNYEREGLATVPPGTQEAGGTLPPPGRVHQPKGGSLPGSRGWNRVYARGGGEWNRLSVLGRVWWRIPENPDKDDNPDITDYLGNGDVVVRWQFDHDKSMSLLVRRSFKAGRGFAQLDWTTRKLFGPARVYIQGGAR